MSDKKIINENSAASGAVSGPASEFFRTRRSRKNPSKAGKPFTEMVTKKNAFEPAGAAVYPDKRSSKGKDPKKLPYKKVNKIENKSEKMLREAIRNLVFLSRIKYHEEQAKIGIQEQKLRKVIRHLINEANDVGVKYNSTGETYAAEYIKKISVVFKEYASLVSKQSQREEFKNIYLTGIKIYLDGLDQQYYILNPQKRQQTAMPAVAQPTQADVGTQQGGPETPPSPAKRSMNEAEVAPSLGSNAGPNPMLDINTAPMQAQAIKSAVKVAGAADPTGHGGADKALARDLPQIDPLYVILTFDEFTNDGGSTNDRKEFRKSLIGYEEGGQKFIGNIANEFFKIDLNTPTNDSPYKNQETPATTPQPLPGQETGAAPVAAPPPETGGVPATAPSIAPPV